MSYEDLKKIIAKISELEAKVNIEKQDYSSRSEALNKKMSAFAVDTANFDELILTYKKRLENVVKLEKDNNQANDILNANIDIYNKDLQSLREQYTVYLRLNDDIRNKIDEYNRLVKTPGSDKNHLVSLKNSIDSETKQLEVMGSELQSKDNELSVRNEALKKREEELEKVRNDIAIEAKKIQELQKNIETWDEKRSQQQKDIQSEKESLAKLQEDINQKDAALSQLKIEKNKIEDDIKREGDPANFIMLKGQLTFDAEGQEGGPYHSRVPHVPSDNSGITIGRGYDLKLKTKDLVISDLTASGLTSDQSKQYSLCVGLQGKDARAYIDAHKDDLVEISPSQQKKLFEITYDRYELDVIRLCGKDDVVKKYGKTDWEKLSRKIQEILIDLHFRGDYDGSAREIIQKSVVSNDLKSFSDAIMLRENWSNVPEDRFERRVSYLKKNMLNLTSSVLGRVSLFSHAAEDIKETFRGGVKYKL